MLQLAEDKEAPAKTGTAIDKRLSGLRERLGKAEAIKPALQAYAQAQRDVALFDRELENEFGAQEKELARKHAEFEAEASKQAGYKRIFQRAKYEYWQNGEVHSILTSPGVLFSKGNLIGTRRELVAAAGKAHLAVEKEFRGWLENSEHLVSTALGPARYPVDAKGSDEQARELYKTAWKTLHSELFDKGDRMASAMVAIEVQKGLAGSTIPKVTDQTRTVGTGR